MSRLSFVKLFDERVCCPLLVTNNTNSSTQVYLQPAFYTTPQGLIYPTYSSAIDIVDAELHIELHHAIPPARTVSAQAQHRRPSPTQVRLHRPRRISCPLQQALTVPLT
jgi:hypothetical protein